MLDVCSALCIGIRFNVDDRCSFAKRSEANQEFIIRRATREGKARAHTHMHTHFQPMSVLLCMRYTGFVAAIPCD